jgi:hypothetical protein
MMKIVLILQAGNLIKENVLTIIFWNTIVKSMMRAASHMCKNKLKEHLELQQNMEYDNNKTICKQLPVIF